MKDNNQPGGPRLMAPIHYISRHLRKPSQALSNKTQDSHFYNSNLNLNDSGGNGILHAFTNRVNVGEQITPKIHGDQDASSGGMGEDFIGLPGDEGALMMLSESSYNNSIRKEDQQDMIPGEKLHYGGRNESMQVGNQLSQKHNQKIINSFDSIDSKNNMNLKSKYNLLLNHHQPGKIMLDSIQVRKQIQTMLKMSPQPKSPNIDGDNILRQANETGEFSSLSSSHNNDQLSNLNGHHQHVIIHTHSSTNMSQTIVALAQSPIIKEVIERQQPQMQNYVRQDRNASNNGSLNKRYEKLNTRYGDNIQNQTRSLSQNQIYGTQSSNIEFDAYNSQQHFANLQLANSQGNLIQIIEDEVPSTSAFVNQQQFGLRKERLSIEKNEQTSPPSPIFDDRRKIDSQNPVISEGFYSYDEDMQRKYEQYDVIMKSKQASPSQYSPYTPGEQDHQINLVINTAQLNVQQELSFSPINQNNMHLAQVDQSWRNFNQNEDLNMHQQASVNQFQATLQHVPSQCSTIPSVMLQHQPSGFLQNQYVFSVNNATANQRTPVSTYRQNHQLNAMKTDENSDTKQDYSPIENGHHQRNQSTQNHPKSASYVNYGRMEHSGEKLIELDDESKIALNFNDKRLLQTPYNDMVFAEKSHSKSRSQKFLPQNYTEIHRLQHIDLPEEIEGGLVAAGGRSVLEGPTVTTSPLNLPNSSRAQQQRREGDLIRHDLMTINDQKIQLPTFQSLQHSSLENFHPISDQPKDLEQSQITNQRSRNLDTRGINNLIILDDGMAHTTTTHQQQQNLFLLDTISQYEQVLAKISNQLQVYVQGNQNLQETIRSQQSDYQIQFKDMQIQFESQIRQLQLQHENKERIIFQQNEQLEIQYKRLRSEYDDIKAEKGSVHGQIEQNQTTISLLKRAEEDARKKIDILHFKISDQEKLIRLKDEEIFTLNSDCMSLTTDLKNTKSNESALKSDNYQLNQKRIDLEQTLTDYKNQLHQMSSNIRASEQAIENLNIQLGSIKQENGQLSSDLEKTRQLSLNERHYNLEQELQQEHKIKQLESDIRVIEAENTELSSTIQQMRVEIIRLNTVEISTKRGNLQTSRNEGEPMYSSNTLQMASKSSIMTSQMGQYISQQRSVGQYSYLQNQRDPEPSVQDHRVSKQEQTDMNETRRQGSANKTSNQKSNNKEVIQWVSQAPTPPPVTQSLQDGSYQFYKQRNNQSQLSNVFQWGAQEANEPIFNNDQQNNTSLQQEQKQQYSSRQPTPNQASNVAQAYQSNSGNSARQKQPLTNIPNQKELLQDGLQARVTFPSNQQFIDQKDRIGKLEQQLQSLGLEKQRLEVEYSKIPPVGTGLNSSAMRKRREDLEGDIDLALRTINTVKQKLRELKAL